MYTDWRRLEPGKDQIVVFFGQPFGLRCEIPVKRRRLMRRGVLLVLGLLTAAMALAAVPAPVQARDLPSALLGVITRPLGAIFGAPRYSRRSYRHRRAAASRSRAVRATPAQVQAARAAA
ncbi:MAG: hypothetical protein K2Z80_08790, partial [Xanthobacteraceae bacterium]|nr:hypothetical protein [Xanthobacteraceae bacterium]